LKPLNLPTEQSQRQERRRAWLYVGLMSLAILFSLPLTPILWGVAIRMVGRGFNNVAYVISLIVLVGLFLFMLRNIKTYGTVGARHAAPRIVAFAALGLICGWLLRYHCRFPAERLHLIEYGLLAFLVFKALLFDFPNAPSYGMAFAFSSLFGLMDEGIQYILPNRNFEWRDVVTNALASALGLLVVRLVTRPRSARVHVER
jgi:glycopeptide antibiotics resistance protein